MQWKLKSTQTPSSLDEVRQILLENRQIKNAEEFFHPRSPLEMSLTDVGIDPVQMARAVKRLELARDKKEEVLIFGDYDADGVCSTAILWEALKQFGIIARPFIPHREKHGYGLSLKSLEAVLSEEVPRKPDLLITVDNGIVAHAAFARLRELGIDAILTDHHLPESTLPDALAVVHSTQLCGSTVAWFLGRELSKKAAEKSLDLTAIATVADQMSMLGISRSFVQHGLEALKKTERVGLQLLIAKANLEMDTLDTNSINYGIAPRINAMGRLKHGKDALRLLCTKSMARADELVHELNDTNVSRQELTSAMVDHARANSHLWETEHIIIVSSTEYHEGVIGLIAGKLSEQFSKPAIAIAIGPQTAKASARSVPGVNIIEFIRLVKSDLLEAGGHPMAAGFGLLSEKVALVSERMTVLARTAITAEVLTPTLDVECLLPAELVTTETIESLADFAPFGQQNREPIFGLQNLQVVGATTMGRESKHLKLQLESQLTAIGWSMGEHASELKPQTIVDIAGVLGINEWKGRKSIQLILKDIQVK